MGEAATERRRALAKAIVAAIAMLCAAAPLTAADPWKSVDAQPQEMVGTLSCSAVSCHGGGGPRYWSGAAAGGEYVHWLGSGATFSEGRRHYDPRARLEASHGDPHALAGQRISSARFQEVLQRASQRADGSVDAGMYARCARCHDPGHEVQSADFRARNTHPSQAIRIEEIPAPRQKTQYEVLSTEYSRVRGIGCETCHGSAKAWLSIHYQRASTREQLVELGMVDTKNLFLRARLCASCHVGSAENDMNHDMIAAGHPPLRFEQASYEALIGTKHWDDRPQRAAEPEYEVQLWAAGRIAAAEAALAVLEGRARRAVGQRSEVGGQSPDAAPWPEFAEGKCFACHQPMRATAGRSLAPRRPSTVAWQSWNLAMLNSVVTSGSVEANELPPVALSPSLSRLRAAMEASVEREPAEIMNLAAAARRALRSATNVDSRGRILDRNGRGLQIRAAVDVATNAPSAISWEETCQRVAALAAARRAIVDATHHEQLQAEQRLLSVAKLLRFAKADREWPAIFATSTDLGSVQTELDAIQRELIAALALSDDTR